MPDLLRQGSDWLESQRTAHMASPVTFRRTGQGEQVIQATFGQTEYEVADDYGATIRAHVVDFLILAEELGLEPRSGDVIVADGRKHELMGLAGEHCWRWSDPYHTTYRIHTKDIGADE